MERPGRTGRWPGLGAWVVLTLAVAWPAGAQVARDSSWMAGVVETVPGPQYDAGPVHRAFFGDHYRGLWTRKMHVPLLSLDRFAGGLTPICRGGGFQTRSLRFQGADGREYVFRSVDKDPTAKLPVMLRETFVADVLQDQISSHHPAGAVVVAPLLEAAGVLHVEPYLALMPDSPTLGQFREDYAGMLGFLEERPTDGPQGTAGFAGSRQISGTERVWDDIEDSPADRVDAHAFLRARLMDMFVGDWDRHFEQWRWARFPAPYGYAWHPIPRDRDQAFSRLDGIVLDFARMNIPELVSFRDTYGDIFGLTWTGRALDRRLLVPLPKAAWDSVVTDLQARLTDGVIEDAVRRLPHEIFETDGEGLIETLIRRRALLPDAAETFYDLLARYVDVHVTDEDEIAEVERSTDGAVTIRVSLAEGDAPPHYERTFVSTETEEVRLYLHGGDDRVVVRGSAGTEMLVRVIGGGGDDVFTDSSTTDVQSRTWFYDARGQNAFQRGLQRSLDRTRFRPPPVRQIQRGPALPGTCGSGTPEAPPADLAVPFRDWGGVTLPTPWTSVQPGLGLFLGVGFTRINYGFRRVPYASKQYVRFGFASGPGRIRFSYSGDFRDVFRNVGADIQVRYSGIENIRFNGFGNETRLDQPEAFYQVTLREVDVAPSLALHLSPSVRVTFGPRFRHARTVEGTGNLIDATSPVGRGTVNQIGGHVGFAVDTRDVDVAATRGVYVTARGFGAAGGRTDDVEYVGVSGEARTYLTARTLPTRPTLALRAAGKRVWGTYPYYEAAYLGGATSLRGFVEQRFAGDASVMGSAELRLFLTRYRILLPGEFGIFGLTDVGRVFFEGESSTRWHGGAGAGIWFAFVDPAATISAAFAKSVEQLGIYITLGFAY